MNRSVIANGAEDARINRWYIAQYRATRNLDAVHAVIREDAIIRVKNNLSQEDPEYIKGQEIYVRVAATDYRAGHIIHVALSYKDACQQLRNFKMFCLRMIYETPVMEFKPHCHDSMLLQYELETNCITYNIVNTDIAVIEGKHKLYEDVVTKIKINNRVIDAVIIRISNDTVELSGALTFMKLKCIDANPPKFVMTTVKSENNAVETNNAVTDETCSISQQLDAMELVMRERCRKLLEISNRIRLAKMELQRLEYNL